MTATTAPPRTDAALAEYYLRTLWDGTDAGVLGVAEFDPDQFRWFPINDLHAAARDVAGAGAAGRTPYASMGLRGVRPASGLRGDSDTITAIAGLWADLDYRGPGHTRDDLPPDATAVDVVLSEAIPHPPTLEIDSGWGRYALWLFREPWTFTGPEERQRAQRMNRALHQALLRAARAHGWHVDNTADLARVLKVPGTVNWKVSGSPQPVAITRDNEWRYTTDELEEVLPDLVEERKQTVALAENGSRGRLTSEELDGFVAGLRAGWNPGSKHNSGVYAAGYLARAGISEEDALEIVGQLSAGDNDPKDRIKAVHDAYRRYRNGQPLSGYHGLRDTVRLPIDALAAIERIRAGFRDRTDPKLIRHHSPNGAHAGANGKHDGAPPKDPPSDQAATAASAAPDAPHLSDLGNAKRLVTRHGNDLRHCRLRGSWFVWDGRRWALDESGEADRRAKETILSLYGQAAALPDNERIALAKHALKSESQARITAMLALAETELGIPIALDQLDRDPMLLNVQNGTIDLRTGELREHRRDNFITRVVPVDYDPAAQCPTWLAFLDRSMAGSASKIAFLQRAVGYSLTGKTTERCFFLLHGQGQNGKTRFLEAIAAILSGYATRTATDTLLASRDTGIPNDIARLRGARFVFASEEEEGRRLAEAKIKELTGGDTITARFMRGEWFDFRAEFKLWMGTNHKPAIRGTDRAIWDRVRLVPFTVRIPEAERDENLLDKLLAEAPGILAWAVAGCLAWQRDGLGEPPEVIAAIEGYRAEMDVIGQFIADQCVITPNAQAPAKALYTAYTTWCEESGERPISQTMFGKRLTERGFDSAQIGKGRTRFWLGIGLIGPNDPDGQGEHVSRVNAFEREFRDEQPSNFSHKETPENVFKPVHPPQTRSPYADQRTLTAEPSGHNAGEHKKHCWACKLDLGDGESCPNCGWTVCACGACGCDIDHRGEAGDDQWTR